MSYRYGSYNTNVLIPTRCDGFVPTEYGRKDAVMFKNSNDLIEWKENIAFHARCKIGHITTNNNGAMSITLFNMNNPAFKYALEHRTIVWMLSNMLIDNGVIESDWLFYRGGNNIYIMPVLFSKTVQCE